MGARGLRMDVTDRRRLVTTLCIFGNAALLTDSLNLSRAGLLDDASEGAGIPRESGICDELRGEYIFECFRYHLCRRCYGGLFIICCYLFRSLR